ncbi:hypothetical protein [Phenylobacterium sp. SCN 70-31]|uniref:hypothetical protein n=1 Tax=Phenylobacterium sp. SCN 70-31 TaxID=1660129 RepID=UPI00086A7055|nr:hypothetical protein [Phenylobacterium sp. SCN 70-31]ODT85142.1 MAG: hypothetical protein ABS78_21405 [Phenylobacterium sp. SCN 70-31]
MSLDLLAILGDAVWIFVMATIASATRRAVKTIPADARLPMQWGAGGRPGWRARRNPAFALAVGLPLIVGLGLSAAARAPGLDASDPLVLFLVRMAIAPVFALVHMLWLRAVVRTLDAEGALRP